MIEVYCENECFGFTLGVSLNRADDGSIDYVSVESMQTAWAVHPNLREKAEIELEDTNLSYPILSAWASKIFDASYEDVVQQALEKEFEMSHR